MKWKQQIGISFGISLLAGGLAVVSFDTSPSYSAATHGTLDARAQSREDARALPSPAGPLPGAPWNAETDASTPKESAYHPEPPDPQPAKRIVAPPPPLTARGPHTSPNPPGRSQDPSSPRLAPIDAKLSEIRASPLGWLSKRVRIDIQLDRTAPSPAQALGAFSGPNWTALHAWPDEVFTWYPAVYRDPAPYLFVPAGSALAESLAETPRFTRLRVVAVVRELFLGEPWLEVETIEELEGFVNEGSILHVGRAIDLLREGSVAMALDQLERAHAAPLPEHARGELKRLADAAREVLHEAGREKH